ncbi:UDP-glucose 4-epimerase [Cytophagales bacterium WSM2-2]|nr:UDP-glucose 4-epimerase [Cytophagales bacterium WSM2-2]
MKILITGGLGYVGGRLSLALSESYDVIVSSRGEVSGEMCNVLNKSSFVNHALLLKTDSFPKGVDTVIHLAALNEIDSVKFPEQAIEVNVNQTRQILENAIRNGVQRIIYFSTIHVYGKSLSGEITEQTLTLPTHPYAITHRAAEDYIMSAHYAGKIQGIVVRMSNSFGPPLFPVVNRWTLLVNDICRQAVTFKQIKLISNGCQFRDFITLTDVIDAIVFLVGHASAGGILNLSSGKSVTVKEMSELVKLVAEKVLRVNVPIVMPPDVPTTEVYFQILPDRLKSIGFVPQNRVQLELEDLISFCNRHFN